jgi:hypothetical protein
MSMSGLALAAILTALAVPSRAAASFTPSVLQCDGSYLAGSTTRHPAPLVRVSISDAIGMKIGTDRTGIVSGATRALWRFDSGVTADEACFASAACGSTFCRRVMYRYSDPNGSQDLELGRCSYGSTNCADNTGLSAGQSRVPISLGACPGAPASGSQSIFAASTLNAARFDNMATSIGTPSVALSTQQTVDWDLGPTYTLSAWIRGTGNGRILTVDGTNGKFWTLGVTGGALRHRDSRDTGNTDVTRGSGLTDGNWHLVHVTRSNGATRNFFIDGRFVGSVVATTTNSFTSHPINSSAAIAGIATGGEYYTGNIDEVRVLTVALSTDDVQLEYNATAHKYSSNAGVTFSTVAGSYTPAVPATRTYGPVTYVPGEAWTAGV